MLALLHGTIGIQHAAMSIYQAYYDRVPVVMIAGNDPGFHCGAHRPRYGRDGSKLHQMGRRAEDPRRSSGGDSARLQRSHHAADGARRWWCWVPRFKRTTPRTRKVPAYKPPTVRDHRFHAREGDRERPAGGAESQDRGGAFANSGRREALGRTRRTGGRVHQHRGDQRPDEFPAAPSPLRPGRGHGLRLHARSGNAAARRLPSPVRRWRRLPRSRDTVNIGFGGICGGGGGAGGGGGGGRPDAAVAEMRTRSYRGRCRGQPSAHHRRSEAPDDARTRRRGFRSASPSTPRPTTRLA